jgi:histidinol-phosphate/aromatic aminotransferase/cobyric acid decarboxylase-like protein
VLEAAVVAAPALVRRPEPAPQRGGGAAGLAHHGDRELAPGLVDLAVNVRHRRPPAWLARRLTEGADGWAAYPDAGPARAALARRHGVPQAAVLPTAGAAEAFSLLAQALPGRRPLVVHPQFTEPELALRAAGRLPERLILNAENGFRLDPHRVPAEADLVLVGSPTNPTGVLHPRATLEALRAPGRVLVVDEAFLDAVPGGEAHSLLGGDLDGVLVLRSLTKTWGLAGIRAGYAVGDPTLVAALAARQPPWSVSTPALTAMVATSAPGPLAEAEAGARALAAARTRLVDGLVGLGLRPVPGAAPFVLVEVGTGVRELLRERGWAVRRAETFPGLTDAWVRIAVRDDSTSEAFLAALASCLPGHPGAASAPVPSLSI